MDKTYLKIIRGQLDKLEQTQEQAIDAVAKVCADAIQAGGLLYFFGTGHAHMLCEEPFYRAGGMACVSPILEPSLMLHQGGAKSSALERLPELGSTVVAESGVGEKDVLFLISNSGRNSVPIDGALEGKKRGAVTVAVTSMTHSSAVTSRHPSGKRLFEVCDYVLDNCGVYGDACIELPGLTQAISPTSTVLGAALINLVMTETVRLLLERGVMPPVFASANTDEGDKANKAVIAEYKKRIRIL